MDDDIESRNHLNMCALVGVYTENVTDNIIQTTQNLMLESKIRGLHATGISYVADHCVYTIKEPISSDLFLMKYDIRKCVDGKTLNFIGHCRYSTSDLEYNQPISSDERSIVHNGVITQESPETWKLKYGIECKGKNDSELLFHKPHSPNHDWPESSIAYVMTDNMGQFSFYRNKQRPLYFAVQDMAVFVFSTEDIGKRSGLWNIKKCDPYSVYTWSPKNNLIKFPENVKQKDWQ